MAFLVSIGLLVLFVGVSTAWVWVSILIGMREPNGARSFFLLLSLFSVFTIRFFDGTLVEPIGLLLTLGIWPIAWYFAFPELIDAKLYYFLVFSLTILAGTLILALMTTRYKRVLTIVVGSVLAVLVPAAIENSVVMARMKSKAEASDLLIVTQSSFFRSAGESFADNRNAHGYACDADNWPSLWSYRNRDWVPLPLGTRFGGDDVEQIKSRCKHNRRYLEDSA